MLRSKSHEMFRNDQERRFVGNGHTVYDQRSETLAKSRSRYVHVSKFKEKLQYKIVICIDQVTVMNFISYHILNANVRFDVHSK
jgi:hypothetical protein